MIRYLRTPPGTFCTGGLCRLKLFSPTLLMCITVHVSPIEWDEVLYNRETTREPSTVNHNQNTFVISVGEHLAAITYAAPWINNQPISYGQAYLILSAVHEELFNEMFSWAKIDNSVEQALNTVYSGYEILVQGKPKLFKRHGNEWSLVSERAIAASMGVVEVKAGSGLPREAQNNVIYRVHGRMVYSPWLDGFIQSALTNIKMALQLTMQRHMGTSLNYEWWYEYAGNGIMYLRQRKADDNYVVPELPESEIDYINTEINLMRAEAEAVPLNITGFENAEGITNLQAQLPALVMNWYTLAMQAGQARININIKYYNPVYLRAIESAIRDLTRQLNVQCSIKSEQVQLSSDVANRAKESVQRRMTERAVQANNQQLNEDANTLTNIRNNIISRNRISDSNMREILSIAPQLQNTELTQQDLYEATNNRANWYKFNSINPTTLDQTVVSVALTLSNHIDMLTGHVPSNTPIPVYKVRAEKQPLSVSPLYSR